MSKKWRKSGRRRRRGRGQGVVDGDNDKKKIIIDLIIK